MDLLTDFMLLRFFFIRRSFLRIRCKLINIMEFKLIIFFFNKETYARVATLAHSHTVFFNIGVLNFLDFATDSYKTSYMFWSRHDRLIHEGIFCL